MMKSHMPQVQGPLRTGPKTTAKLHSSQGAYDPHEVYSYSQGIQIIGELKRQQTGSKSGKEHVKTVYCHPAYLTYICRVHHTKCQDR